jgi:hypothetical protein
VNWGDAARAGLARVRDRVRQAPHDEDLVALVALAEAAVAELAPGEPSGEELIVCPSSWRATG